MLTRRSVLDADIEVGLSADAGVGLMPMPRLDSTSLLTGHCANVEVRLLPWTFCLGLDFHQLVG